MSTGNWRMLLHPAGIVGVGLFLGISHVWGNAKGNEVMNQIGIRKIVTYNIHIGIGMDRKLDLSRIAGVLKKLNPDLCAVNEIDVACERSGRLDQLAVLGELLGQGGVFAQARPIGRHNGYEAQGPVPGAYGIAAFGQKPLLVMEQFALPLPDDMEPRTVLIVRTVEKFPVYFIVTHLPWEPDEKTEALRCECLKVITARIKEKKYRPAILAGDLNAGGDSRTIAYLRQEWGIAGDGDWEPTHPADRPKVRLDYIAFYPKTAFEVMEYQVVPEIVASDHRPFAATLKQIEAAE